MRSAWALDPPSASATTHLFCDRSGWHRGTRPRPRRSHHMPPRIRPSEPDVVRTRCITGTVPPSELLRGAYGLTQARASRPAVSTAGRDAGDVRSPGEKEAHDAVNDLRPEHERRLD